MRNVVPEIYKSRLLWRLHTAKGLPGCFGGLLWLLMICVLADDQGRMLDEPGLMAANWPWRQDHVTKQHVERSLRIMEHNGSILRYQARNGEHLIQLVNWWRYQRKANHMGPSRYAPPAKWLDRCNYAGPGRRPILEHWDLEGGYSRRSRKDPMYSRKPAPLKLTKPRRGDSHRSMAAGSDKDSD